MKPLLSPDMNVTLQNAAAQNKTMQRARELSKVEETAKDFEAVFISEMMKPMFEGISTEGPFGGGKGEEVFRSMMIQEYGKMMSRTGSIGLSNALKEQMILMQTKADNLSAAAKNQAIDVEFETLNSEGILAHDTYN